MVSSYVTIVISIVSESISLNVSIGDIIITRCNISGSGNNNGSDIQFIMTFFIYRHYLHITKMRYRSILYL